jgi:CRISPR/Cas system-associated exonuclease Cas4 (RecB family)
MVNSYLRCPKAFEYRYIHGLKIAPAWAVVGRSAHAAEETNMKQKLVSHSDLPLADMHGMAVEEFEKTVNSGTEEIMWENAAEPGQAKDRTVFGVTSHHTLVAPKIQPLMVEHEINLVLPWGTPITGRVDLIDQDTAIRDTKHVSYRPRPGEEWYQSQPGLYGWMYKAQTGEIPKFRLDYVVLGRKDVLRPKPDVVSVETKMSDQRIKLALDRVQQTEKLIRSGAAPANASERTCSGCGYRKLCPYSAAT